jgi:calcium-dependent protein kinase
MGRFHREPRRLEDDYIVHSESLGDAPGDGTSAKIRLASSRIDPQQRFAVKTLRLDSGMRAEQKGEVENYLCMDHPHIARLYDVYESKQHVHFVMECLEGGDLLHSLQSKGRFSEAEARKATRQLLLALNYMHSHGIVHRDVKLENAVCDEQGFLKLIDFGLSVKWARDSGKTLRCSCGTLPYCAPEVLGMDYTSQCDIWSLGVLTYSLLAGAFPFQGSDAELKRQILSSRYSMDSNDWDDVSMDAKQFVSALLESDPSKRLTAQEALQHPWISESHSHATTGLLEVAQSLKQFAQLSHCARICKQMSAWSLSNKDQCKVRDYFLALDVNQQGTITLKELGHALLDQLKIQDYSVVQESFDALDYNNDEEITYSEFLAAMVGNQIEVTSSLTTATFHRFDSMGSGFITKARLRDVIGNGKNGTASTFLNEINPNNDGYLRLEGFHSYLTTIVARALPSMSLPTSKSRHGLTQANRHS